MIESVSIPILQYIKKHMSLPKTEFEKVITKQKKMNFFFSMLKNNFQNNSVYLKNYFITRDTFDIISVNLTNLNSEISWVHFIKRTYIFTVTISDNKNNLLITNLCIITPMHDSAVVDILVYNGLELFKWLSCSYQNHNNIYISISYNLEKQGVDECVDFLHFIMNLISLKEFEQFFVTPESIDTNISDKVDQKLDFKIIDISYLRDYLVPTKNRRSHYRWQLCGKGRSSLRLVKVRATVVKEHIRQGKRFG